MRRTTSLAAAVAVALCSLTFAACGGDDTSSDSSSGKIEGEISLLAPEYSDNTEGWWRDVISKFEKANPGAKVKLQMVSWTDINQKITTLVSTNQAPDVLNLDAYANFAGDDLLLPADEVLSPETQRRLHRQVRRERQVRRHAVRDPVRRLGARALLQQGHVQAGGHPEPADDVGPAARGRQEDQPQGRDAATGCRSGPRRRRPSSRLYMWGNGGDWVDGDTWTINKPQNVEALEFMNELANQDKVTQPNPGTTNRTDLWKVFGAGKIGMVMGSNFYPVLLKAQNPKLNYGVAPVPVNGPTRRSRSASRTT